MADDKSTAPGDIPLPVVQCPDCVPGTGYICELHRSLAAAAVLSQKCGSLPMGQSYIMWELREEQFNLIVDLLKSLNKGIGDLESAIELIKPRSEE